MSFIVNAITSHPEHITSQEDVKKMLFSIWPHKKSDIEDFIESTNVETRYLSLPLNYYRDLKDFGKRNVIWKAEALRLQKENIQKMFDQTQIDIADIGLIASVTTTGLSVPSLEALMMNEFPFSPATKRLPIFGLGCLAGVAGMNRINDYLLGHPEKAALLLVTELCSLNFQFEEDSISNMIGTMLFGDGAGAVLMVGEKHKMARDAHFEIISTESIFYPDTERMMGWDVIDSGFQLVLSNDIPELIREKLGKNIDEFLIKNNIARNDINFYIAQPGGPKVLDAICETMELSKDKLGLSFESLSKYGNASAASVINVLEKSISCDIAPHNLGLMMAMGSAFSLELSLVRKC